MIHWTGKPQSSKAKEIIYISTKTLAGQVANWDAGDVKK